MTNLNGAVPLNGHLADPISQPNPLRPRLVTRQDGYTRPQCGSHNGNLHYNTPLHVIALIIILVLSTLACSFPIIARRFPRFPVPHRFLFLSRHFGTGVLIATAFVHLLPTAFISLTDPCLPPFWNKGYPAMAGFIALISVLAVVGVEMFFATRGAGHVHGSEYGRIDQDATASTVALTGVNGNPKESPLERRGFGPFRRGSIATLNLHDTLYDAAKDLEEDEAARRKSFQISDEESELERASWDGVAEPEDSGARSRVLPDERPSLQHSEDDHQPIERSQRDHLDSRASLTQQLEERKMLLQCLLLEAGILFHSVFIGMALSVATGTPFIVLLVAISFHQTFEGLALGSRIAAITSFGPRSVKPWLMALAYGTTTPIGQAIGLGVHNLYDPESEMGLIMVGVFNSLSSGLLLFAGLVELLAADFLSDESYETLQGRKRLEACGAVVAGALLMALVGAWA